MSAQTLIDPIVLLCSERSGSNLIAKIFDAHPDVCAPGTSHLFNTFAQIAWTYDDPEALRNDLLDLFEAKVGSWLIDAQERDARHGVVGDADTAAVMIARLMNAERVAAGKRTFFLKENFVYRFVPFLEAVAPRPRYVFMVRDPRNMAVSWQRAAVLRGGPVRAARRWVEDQQGILRLLSWFGTGRTVAQLTYEDLVASPEATLRRVCATLGLAFDLKVLDFGNASRSAQADAARSSVWANLSRPIFANPQEAFLDHLSDDALAFVEALCGPLMHRFGYEKARPKAAPPFGRYADLAALEAALSAAEPWEKPQYHELPMEERGRFERWSSLNARLRQRSAPQAMPC